MSRSRARRAYSSTTWNGENVPRTGPRPWTVRSVRATRAIISGRPISAGSIGRPVDEARHQAALRPQEGHDFRCHPDGGGGQVGGVLDLPVDPEQIGALAHQAQDERRTADINAEVVIGDAAAKGGDLQRRVVPAGDAGDGLFQRQRHFFVPSPPRAAL